MTTSVEIELGDVVRAATWNGRQVWLATGSSLMAFTPEGERILRRDAPVDLASLVATPDGLVAGSKSGLLVWLDDSSGEEVARRPLGGQAVLVGGPDAAFAVDTGSDRAWAVARAGTLGPAVPVPTIERAAVVGGALWWTSRVDTVLRGNGMEVELGPLAKQGEIVGCAGSIWVSLDRALLRVGAWGGDTSEPLPAPFGPALLSCGSGRLLGASARGVFLLDPSIDADVRTLDLDFEIREEPITVVATKVSAWLFFRTSGRARVLTYR